MTSWTREDEARFLEVFGLTPYDAYRIQQEHHALVGRLLAANPGPPIPPIDREHLARVAHAAVLRETVNRFTPQED